MYNYVGDKMRCGNRIVIYETGFFEAIKVYEEQLGCIGAKTAAASAVSMAIYLWVVKFHKRNVLIAVVYNDDDIVCVKRIGTTVYCKDISNTKNLLTNDLFKYYMTNVEIVDQQDEIYKVIKNEIFS